MNILKAPALSCLLLTMSTLSIAETPSHSGVGSSLPHKIRALLIEEMVAVRNASQTILDALVKGQDGVVAENAQAIHDSFIMAKKMSAEEKKTLVSAVPPEFLIKDKAFHKLSAKLAAAARSGDKPLQKQLFSEMINACTECHSDHASDRFPGLAIGD